MKTASKQERTLELPSYFKEFLDLWSPYMIDPVLRDIYANDPIWDWIPLICERSEHVWNASFISFWLPDGRLAFPAVTTRNSSFRSGDRILQQGQSIRDAYLKKEPNGSRF
jgi:hypothetical protein